MKNLSKEYSSFWLPEGGDNLENMDSEIRLLALVGLRRAISNFVYILTGKDIPVRFAETDRSFTDGKTICIGGALSHGEIDQTVGLALHEGCHIVKSDFDLVKTAWGKLTPGIVSAAKGKLPMNRVSEFAVYVLNLVEDRYIDAWVQSVAPGYKGYYSALYEKYFYAPKISLALQSADYREPTFKSYEFRFTNIINPATDLDALPGLRKASELLKVKNILRPELSTPASRLELAMEIVEIFIKEIASAEDKEEPDSAETSGDEQSDETGEEGSSGTQENENDDSPESGSEPTSGDDDSTTTSDGEDGDTPEDAPSPLSQSEREEVEEVHETQKQFVNRQLTQTGIDQTTLEKLDAIESSKTELVRVGGEEGVPSVGCIFVKCVTIEHAMSSTFPFHIPKSLLPDTTAILDGISLGASLGRRLKIRDEVRVTKTTRLDRGKIDRRLLASIATGEENLFYQYSVEQYKKIHLHLSVDASGSMGRENKWSKTVAMAIAIAKACSMVQNVTVSISLRGTKGTTPGWPYVAIVYDSRVDKLNKLTEVFSCIAPVGATPEGLAFQAILDNLPPTTHDMNSVFVNISDGFPAFNTYRGKTAFRHTRKQVDKIRAKGITVMSYFIETEADSGVIDGGHSAFKEMYGKDAHFVDVNSVTQIAYTLNSMFLEKK